MKKVISILAVIIMLTSLVPLNAEAATMIDQQTNDVKLLDADAPVNVDEAKTSLGELGFDGEFVDVLSEGELLEYSQGDQIMTYTSVVSYEASNETREPGDSTNSGRASDGLLPPHIVVDPGGNSSVSKEAERYDVEFKLVVYDLGDGRYRCTLDATYLNMPDDKEWDGLGIAVQGCTFDGNALPG